MITINQLSFSFPEKELFKNVSFTIEDGRHCAFIGTSGSGKSTLVTILMDPDRYMYDGNVEMDSDLRTGYISQFLEKNNTHDMTVFQYIAEPFLKCQHEIDTLAHAMASAVDLEPILEKYQMALDAFEAIDGHDYELNIQKKLNLAGLAKLRDLSIYAISGGEFKLIQVIKEMLLSPDLIIMDEPDVFLDFENLNALRMLINTHKGMMLVITHNRYLLQHCFNKIIHLENTEIQEFDGNYIDYNFSLLQTKIEMMELSIADDEEIERNQVLIDKLRFIASYNSEAARGKSLKARVKIQERLEARRIKAPFVAIKKPNITLTATPELDADIALSVRNYHATFDDVLLENVSFEIGPTDKVALIGANGSGKTTLLRDLYQHAAGTKKSIAFHEGTSLAYLSQMQSEVLDTATTIRDAFFDIGFKTTQAIQVYIQRFGFDEAFLDQKLGALSGGEKNILQLALISASKANFLLLDEPTSHLDTYAQVALEEAITNYNGALIMISHDYYTIANCMDYVLLIENKTIRKMSLRKFRKMIYANHFNKYYLEMEQNKKALELKIEMALKQKDYETAKRIVEELEDVIKLMSA